MAFGVHVPVFNNFAIALFSHPFLIFVLKISTVGSSFISSLRFFDNMLPLNERDSMPKFIVFVIGNKIYSKCVRFTQMLVDNLHRYPPS